MSLADILGTSCDRPNAEARFNNSLRSPRKPEGSLGRTAQPDSTLTQLLNHLLPGVVVANLTAVYYAGKLLSQNRTRHKRVILLHFFMDGDDHT